MRVLNEKESTQEQAQPPDWFAVLMGMLFCLAGYSTVALPSPLVVFAPLPIIGVHLRLAQPLPQVAALGGAVAAMLLLGAPTESVLLVFISGVIAADSIKKRRSVWLVLLGSAALGTSLIFLMLFGHALFKDQSFFTFWNESITTMVGVLTEQGLDKETAGLFRDLIYFEGPFLAVSALLLIFWISIGTASHFKWFPKKHPFHATEMRKLRLPVWLSLAFGALLVLRLNASTNHYIVDGLFKVAGTLMFVQGSIFLSVVMSKRRVSEPLRSILYAVSLTIGSYAIVGVGALGSWLFKPNNKQFLEAEK